MSESSNDPVFSPAVYQQQAIRTSSLAKLSDGGSCPPYASGQFAGQSAQRVYVAGLGLVGETGELMDLLKKVIGHGHEYDATLFSKEMGDQLWYISEILSAIGQPLSEHVSFDRLQSEAVEQLGDWRSIPAAFTLDEDRGRFLSLVANMMRSALNIYTMIHLMVVVGREGIQISVIDHAVRVHLLLWFKAVATLGLSSEAVAMANLAKLQKRYPAGFSTSSSLDRVS